MSTESTSTDETARRDASALQRGVRPPAQDLTGDVAWLWTHCRALGMDCRSDSGLMSHDVALYTKLLHDQLRGMVTILEALRTKGDSRYCYVESRAGQMVRVAEAIDEARRLLGPNARGKQRR